MKLYAVIMCGGRGERFWPRSRRNRPKQFIELLGNESLTRLTSERMKNLCPVSRQLFVAPAEFEATLKRQLGLKARSLLFEPVGRNTAPAIGLAAAHLARTDPDATMVVLPADHLIKRQQAFETSVRLAAKLAQDGLLVTFGVPPTRPDTGYGYVRVGEKLAGRGKLTAHRVLGFKEKPDPATAKRYVAQGNYLWNSGMFVWRVDAILEAFGRYMPAFRRSLQKLTDSVGTRREKTVLAETYRKVRPVSIDYAVMEKADNIAAVRATFDWDDVGSWLALARHVRADRQGNVTHGLTFTRDARDCIIDSDRGVIAVLGVRDLVVVRSGDAVLVTHKDKVAGIRELLKEMSCHREAEEYL